MKRFEKLIQKINAELKREEGSARHDRNYSRLVELADSAAAGLNMAEKISRAEVRSLCQLSWKIHEYTNGLITEGREYEKNYEYNTPDYHIMRQLVLRFSSCLRIKDLEIATKVYFFDGILISRAIERMISLRSIEGLCWGILHTQCLVDKSKKSMKYEYYQRLLEHAGDADFAFEKVWLLLQSGMVPFGIRKGLAELILKNGLLNGITDVESRVTKIHFCEKLRKSRKKKDYTHS